ncbi:hypothetical protein BU25DRAFT_122717 [Macroventuria anomochaeta]|uniref:Uncharacterized protein n=1 Tax=Macroventuria anomochaeta TaxID=301207 RepID=A0ACB6RTP4_9PLEO|nr:uncharacterized protein BU25DRAFT_122717 [Macroventuria anomochaeta]KAF2625082.1 hypothetical protein BU25DRAFT_122717 [Macroventuria anomochaeta]
MLGSQTQKQHETIAQVSVKACTLICSLCQLPSGESCGQSAYRVCRIRHMHDCDTNPDIDISESSRDMEMIIISVAFRFRPPLSEHTDHTAARSLPSNFPRTACYCQILRLHPVWLDMTGRLATTGVMELRPNISTLFTSQSMLENTVRLG